MNTILVLDAFIESVLDFESLLPYVKDCLLPKIFNDKSKSKLLRPIDFDLVSNKFQESNLSSSYLNSSIKSTFSGVIFSTDE